MLVSNAAATTFFKLAASDQNYYTTMAHFFGLVSIALTAVLYRMSVREDKENARRLKSAETSANLNHWSGST